MLSLGKQALRHHFASKEKPCGELLDNPERVPLAGRWHLRGFLDRMTDAVHRLPHWQGAPRAVAAAAVYRLLGAVNHCAVSGPTFSAMLTSFDRQLEHAALTVLAAGPAQDQHRERRSP